MPVFLEEQLANSSWRETGHLVNPPEQTGPCLAYFGGSSQIMGARQAQGATNCFYIATMSRGPGRCLSPRWARSPRALFLAEYGGRSLRRAVCRFVVCGGNQAVWAA